MGIFRNLLEASNSQKVQQKDDSKAKGDAFENYVIGKFNRSFFTLQDMRSDKGKDGFYPESNKYPDLVLQYNPKKISFAVECKWRKGWWKNNGRESIGWAGGDEKIRNYNDYSEKNNIPVFIAIGIGGEPDNPAELFVAPLKALKYRYAQRDYLNKFIKKSKDKDFFFDPEKIVLK